jgi:peptide chain release factor 3
MDPSADPLPSPEPGLLLSEKPNEAAPEGEQRPLGDRRLHAEVQRRKTFAIISHPDAGKTTLTEKLLLYSGSINVAGAVRGRKAQRAATSDWMEMERERGISITSTVLTLEYGGFQLNLLDTPGHQDFSEDTYRTLTAADSAVMVLDAAKGIEAQTEKLFKVCAMRKIPIFTFINKMDRPGRNPLQLLSEIEQVLGIDAVPLNWPIGRSPDFRGVYDLERRKGLLFQKVPENSLVVPTQEVDIDENGGAIDATTLSTLREEVELLDVAGVTFDKERFLRGSITPVFYGSALTNFGIEPFLDAFLKLAPPPGARGSDQGKIPAERADFGGFVFKIQANLDPRHRDRVAFVRVCSGRFVREMDVVHARTGEKVKLRRAHRLFAQGRETMDEAFPGDIIGLVNPGQFRLGDTLCTGPRLNFDPLPEFSPECFATITCADTARRKQFGKGLEQLVEEGAVQMLSDTRTARRDPILAAVGELQFEVVTYRLESEYDVKATMSRLPYTLARWAWGDAKDLEEMQLPYSARKLADRRGQTVVLFGSTWDLQSCLKNNPKIAFTLDSIQPAAKE